MITVGIAGVARAGKTTTAQYIKERSIRFAIESFAAPLKKAAKIIYPQIPDEDWANENKDKVNPTVDMSPRYILQRLGTEVGRQVHQETWTMNMQSRVDFNAKLYYNTIIDDCRFPNELDVCDYLIYMERPSVAPVLQHESESHVDELRRNADWVVNNNSSLDELYITLNELVEWLDEKSGN